MHFPGEQQLWYDHWTHEKLEKAGSHNVAAPYEKVIEKSHIKSVILALRDLCNNV